MKVYTPASVTLFNSLGLFDNPLTETPHVTPRTLAEILTNPQRNIWSDDHFEPSNPPTGNAGANLCYDCRKVYWVTPDDDAYHREGKAELGSVCNPCLLNVGPINRMDADFIKVRASSGYVLLPVKDGEILTGEEN